MFQRSTAPHGRRFPQVIMNHAVWLYLRLPLSYRDFATRREVAALMVG